MSDGSALILIIFMPGLLLAVLLGFWSIGRAGPIRGLDAATTTPAAKSVSIWPYALGCYLALGLVYLVLIAIHLLWPAAPRLLSLSAPLISIFTATWLFAKVNQRSFLTGEKWWFTLGCFAAFWIYDAMQGLVLLMVRGNVTGSEVAIKILGAAFDFALVWFVVTCCAVWATHYTSAVRQRRLTNVGGVRESR